MIGVAGAMWGFLRLGSWEPLAFDINRSFQILFMVIIGGLGSILGSFLGAAFIVLTPIVLNQIPGWLGIPMSKALISHIEQIGRAHVCTPVTNSHLVCLLLLAKKQNNNKVLRSLNNTEKS